MTDSRRTGVARWGRTIVGMMICTAMTIANVTAIAGTVRRISSPAATPRANAKAVCPSTTYPRASNTTGVMRLKAGDGGGVERARPPGHRQRDESRGGDRGQADEAELDGQPAAARDALLPDQVLRSGLELTADQWGAPEHAHDDGQGDHEQDESHVGAQAGEEEVVEAFRATLCHGTQLAESAHSASRSA